MSIGKAVKAPFKIVGWIILIVLLLFIGVNAYLCYVGFPAKVKDMVVEQMQKQLHRQVEIQKVGICLLKGFIVRGVTVMDKGKSLALKDKDKDSVFVECKAFVFKYDLSELLKRKIKIEKLTLESPQIRIKRYMKGKEAVFNFSDMIPPAPKKAAAVPVKKAKPKAAAKAAAAPMPKVSKSAIPIDLQVEKVGLENAMIEVVDTATPKFREVYKLDNVHFLVENIKIKENAPISLKTGFGLSVTEYDKKSKAKSDKDINLEAEIAGVITLFDKKGIMNPNGYIDLALRNGKFTGIQAYEELRNQVEDLNKSIAKYQDDLLASFEKMKKQLAANQDKLNKAGAIGGKVKGAAGEAGKAADKLGNMDMSFLKGALDCKFLSKTLEFSEIKTRVKIQDGKFITDDLKAESKDFKVTGSGWTSMDTTVAYKMHMLADKKYNKNIVTKAIASPDGSLDFPVRIGGTVSAMKVIFEKADILKKIQNSLKEELMKQLKSRGADAENLAKQMLGKYTGDYGKYLDKGGATAAVDDAKKKAEAEAAAVKAKAEAEAEAAKKKAEEEAKQKAAEEAKKQIKKLKF